MDPPKAEFCAKCGKPLGDDYWTLFGVATHPHCFEWTRLTKPPYLFRLRELRRRYARVKAEMSALYAAGKALRAAQAEWPENALEHAENIIEAFQKLDLKWPRD